MIELIDRKIEPAFCKSVLLFIALLIVTEESVFAGQRCPGDLIRTAMDRRFIASTNGGVIDKQTGLKWKRCLVGQTFEEGYCQGSPTLFRIGEVLEYMRDLKLASAQNNNGWRLPNIKELASIVERGCVDPAINLKIFPTTPNKYAVYSSTPTRNRLLTIDLVTGAQKSSVFVMAVGGVSGGPAMGYRENYVRLVSEH